MTPAPRYIAVEGPIGVGKTTLAGKVAAAVDGALVLESVDGKMLGEFYSGKPGSAMATELLFLYSRARQQDTIRRCLAEGRSVVTDYTFDKSRIFSRLNLSARDERVYRLYLDHFDPVKVMPDLVVYLQGSLESIQKRIRRRDRAYEKKLRSAYLRQVIAAYREQIFSAGVEALLVVNTDDINVADVKSDVDDLIRVIMTAPHGVHYYHPPGSD